MLLGGFKNQFYSSLVLALLLLIELLLFILLLFFSKQLTYSLTLIISLLVLISFSSTGFGAPFIIESARLSLPAIYQTLLTLYFL